MEMHIQTVNCIQHNRALCEPELCSLHSAVADLYWELISAGWSYLLWSRVFLAVRSAFSESLNSCYAGTVAPSIYTTHEK